MVEPPSELPVAQSDEVAHGITGYETSELPHVGMAVGTGNFVEGNGVAVDAGVAKHIGAEHWNSPLIGPKPLFPFPHTVTGC
ncbi:MAG TPA: hypothetical protein VMT61_14650 [Candidatus Binataceae bacterium]|nr:hypothetical protein [Candidatus Binataceae bacterium]